MSCVSAEGAKLNAALERLEAAEAKAYTMESVAYGGVAISILLLAIVSYVLFVNRRKATAAKREGVEPETKPSEVIRDSAVVAPESLKVCDTASPPPELAQPSSSDAAIRESREEVGVSKTKGGAEEYVTLPT